ncbi:MAG: Type 1 glutamine amidotransferase-like domain-containing protein [Polyangiaceae bacterium]
MLGTALVYSSHNRGDHLHDNYIVQRALRGNHRILFLPISETVQNGSELERQDYSWGTFRWYFDFYRKYGLQADTFYWTSNLGRGDVEALWDGIENSEVVILGGGNPRNGMKRYKNLGYRFADGEWGKFGRLLHERRARGLLTVGFSAGADQLCDSLFARTWGDEYDGGGFGLVRNTMVTLHHEPSRNDDLAYAAAKFPHNMVFGLPNDSGLNHDWGVLPSGNIWQVYEFVIDNSWSVPSEQFHVKTRYGAQIEHFYNDGRHWSFSGGDMLVRIESPDLRYREAWIRSRGSWVHYWSQSPSSFHSVEQILAHH